MRQFLFPARPFLISLILFAGFRLQAQSIDQIVNPAAVEKIEKVLSADDMQGRASFSPGIERAADFIEAQFRAAGLQTWNGSPSYRQTFSLIGGNAVKAEPDSSQRKLANVVGILPGRSKKNEYVIFSGHYDHLGIGTPDSCGDSIYNGANDDASGTTAVIMLARYFSKKHDNERTLVFAAFTAEEIGEYGSQYFSRQFDPSSVMAMFNIEMIGTGSKWGKNSAYITGFERTDMGRILEKNLQGSPFTFYPDPYPEQGLFYRSDNASLARQGVPAHTISTSKMDSEKYYHTQADEIGTLDMDNMARIIRSIALASRSIVRGVDTPTRVDTTELK
jgi:Zn-dependent M28 family amino/carboxypeptidase